MSDRLPVQMCIQRRISERLARGMFGFDSVKSPLSWNLRREGGIYFEIAFETASFERHPCLLTSGRCFFFADISIWQEYWRFDAEARVHPRGQHTRGLEYAGGMGEGAGASSTSRR